MSVTSLGFNDVLTAIQGVRPHASPNFGFRNQLVNFERNKLSKERQRLKEKYGESTFYEADMLALMKNIQQRLHPDENAVPVSKFLRKVTDDNTSEVLIKEESRHAGEEGP